MKYCYTLLLVFVLLSFSSCKKYDAFGNEILFEELYKSHWLIGSWQLTDSLGVLQETWSIQDDSTYSGVSYYIKEKKDTIHSEQMTLMEDKGDLFYTTTITGQNGNNAMVLKMKSATDSLVVFENTKNEHPSQIEYKFVNDSTVISKITGKQNGKLDVKTYQYHKISTPKKG